MRESASILPVHISSAECSVGEGKSGVVVVVHHFQHGFVGGRIALKSQVEQGIDNVLPSDRAKPALQAEASEMAESTAVACPSR